VIAIFTGTNRNTFSKYIVGILASEKSNRINNAKKEDRKIVKISAINNTIIRAI
jgi:hypothetical protein